LFCPGVCGDSAGSGRAAASELATCCRADRAIGWQGVDLHLPDVEICRLRCACTETQPGTVVVSGLPKMYYGGVIQSTGAALNEATKKENERIRIEAEASKTYYMKWTSEAMATGIKVTQVDEATGTREIKKLHVSKPAEEKDSDKQEAK
jgi:hypothetical protein